MASQRITIAKIGGDSANAVISRFDAWSKVRTTDDPTEWSPDQWPPSLRRQMDSLATALRTNGHKPPVVFFNEHIDLWSMGDLFTRWFPAGDSDRLVQLHADHHELWCYPLPDAGRLAENLQRAMRRKRVRERNPQEDRWFTLNLLEAVYAWQPMVDTAAIVVLRSVLGGLVEDSEVKESLACTPNWIADLGRET